MKKRIYIKPVSNSSEMFGWITLEMNILESFLDDRIRYGTIIAVYNFVVTATGKVGRRIAKIP